MRELEDLELAVKVLIVGNGAVGKSSMIQRYCRGTFTKDYKKTIGVDFLERCIDIDGEEVRLMLWDTAGQEEFDAITKAYYRGAQACVLAFSTTDRASFFAVKRWKKKVEDECGDIPMVLVQNKIDLIERAAVLNEETEALARELKLRLYRTSVKENVNVDQVFRYVTDLFLSELQEMEEENASHPAPCHIVRDVFALPSLNHHRPNYSSPTTYSKVIHNGRLESTIKLRPHKIRTSSAKWNAFRNNC